MSSDPFLQRELGDSFIQGVSDLNVYSQNKTSDYGITESEESNTTGHAYFFFFLI